MPPTVVVSEMLAVTGLGKEGTVTVRMPGVDGAGCTVVGAVLGTSSERGVDELAVVRSDVTLGKPCIASRQVSATALCLQVAHQPN